MIYKIWPVNYCTCRKPGTPPSYAPSCVNWWCWGPPNDGDISTQLIGNGRGRLSYGLCNGGGENDTSAKVTVYLNGNEISSNFGGSVRKVSKDVDFDYSDGDIIKIEETGKIVFQFNSFTELGCNSKWFYKTFKWHHCYLDHRELVSKRPYQNIYKWYEIE